MSGPVTAALRELIALGVQGQALVEAVGRIEAAAIACRPQRDPAMDRRREWDRIRKSKIPRDWNERRAAVFERDGFVCSYCFEPTTDPQCDHVVPLARGGSSEMDNLVTACRPCNSSKRDLPLEEWRAKSCS